MKRETLSWRLCGRILVLMTLAARAFCGDQPVPSFPGAEGFGAQAIGGRGGRVIEVTNLNDDGPGSLRAACSASGPRIVVFRVAGVITLESRLVILEPYLTIAGQTAPGDGACLRGAKLQVSADHVVIRYLRVRPGDDPDVLNAGNRDCRPDYRNFDVGFRLARLASPGR